MWNEETETVVSESGVTMVGLQCLSADPALLLSFESGK